MPGPLTLAEIAARLGGRVLGRPDTLIRQVGTLENAGTDQISFLANARYKAQLLASRAGAVILAGEAERLTTLPRIVCDDPYAYFARVSQLLNPAPLVQPRIDPAAQIAAGARIAASARVETGAVVGEGAEIGERAWIGAGCCIGEHARIGEDVRLYPQVVVYHDCRLGDRVTVHSGVVIGADGFGLAWVQDRWLKIPQIGRVLIGNDVEIGANTTIDRGAIDDTVIEDGVKLDNQIQVGHNVRIGAHTAIAGCVGIAGSADIGRYCTIGGAAMILGHLRIVDHVNVATGTLISRSIHQPGTYAGMFPFDDLASWKRNAALVRHLSELAGRVKELEKRLYGKGNEENG